MTLEARSFRDRCLDHLIFDADPRRHLAAEPLLALSDRLRRLCRLVHAARFDRGATLQAFQAGDLFALFANDRFQGGNLSKQFNQQSLKLGTAQSGKGRWRRHIRKESDRVEPEQEKNAPCPRFCPYYIFILHSQGENSLESPAFLVW